jgi:hypothetical protein
MFYNKICDLIDCPESCTSSFSSLLLAITDWASGLFLFRNDYWKYESCYIPKIFLRRGGDQSIATPLLAQGNIIHKSIDTYISNP